MSGNAIEVDVARLPHRDVVSRFAQAFGFDPLGMISSGTLAATAPPAIEAALGELEIPFARAGRISAGRGVRVIEGDEVSHYVEVRPEADELARMWERYPRD